MDMAATENNRLLIRRFHAQYLVSAQHPAPERVKDRLDGVVTHHLASTLSAVFASWFSAGDPSVWLIRRLEIDAVVNAAWEQEQLTRTVATQLARTLGATLQDGSDQDNVQRFPNRAAYLAHFLTDLAIGDAWGRWYYESFAGLRLLPTSAALRTAVCKEPETGQEALWQLTNDELKQVLRTLTTQDARRILETLAEHATVGDELRCCQAAWEAWQLIAADISAVAEEWRQALHLYLAASREREEAEGLNLKRATIALLRLARRLAGAPAEQGQHLLDALTGGDMASLYAAAGAGDAEALLPLQRCPPTWVCEVTYALLARNTGQTTPETTTMPGRRDTAFGGIFLLLPLLDELPLVEAARHWPHADEAAAISLVRFLLLVKCCGQEQAQRAFYDPLLRDLLLIPPTISPAVVRDWQANMTTAHLHSFLETLLDWQSARGALRGEKQILAVSHLRGRPVAALIDAARGLWLLLHRHSPRRPQQLSEALRDRLVQLAHDDGLLVCDASLLALLKTEFPALQVMSFTDQVRATTPGEESQIGEIVARLDKLSEELVYLALPASMQLTRSFDLALSIVAQHVLRAFAWRLPGFARSNLPYLSRNFLEFAGSLEEEPVRRVVRLGRPPLHLVMNMTGMTRQTYRLSWLDERPLVLFQEA
jgi:hypothetical protein